jgi:hypothetical protein
MYDKQTGRLAQYGLTQQVQWPNLTSNATTGGHTGLASGSGGRKKLEKLIGRKQALKLNAKLNPAWVEQLMGLPKNWTQL